MTIEDIAGRHLGKTTHYNTPDGVDPSLLVAIPRILNRERYAISADQFVGFDTWNAYEVSFLSHLNRPVACIAKIIIPADSEFIVESKSLKLYLNSYNMQKFNSIDHAQAMITGDLDALLGIPVKVLLASASSPLNSIAPIDLWNTWEVIDWPFVGEFEFEHFSEHPELLRSEHLELTDEPVEYYMRSSVLRSNCRVTNQPDWGDVFIYLKTRVRVWDINIYEYLASFRNENHFHEEVCEVIYKRLQNYYSPEELFVSCLYTRRGGIDINPARASDPRTLTRLASGLASPTEFVLKTARQ